MTRAHRIVPLAHAGWALVTTLAMVACAGPPSTVSHEEARARHVLIVGLDGATWDVLDPLLAGGRLPTLARLVENGSRATLLAERGRARSGPSWTTLASGKLSDKHGITRNEGTVEVGRFWDALSGAGLRSAVIGWILTYPVRPLDGWMLSGPFGEKQSFPAGLLSRLEEELGPYLPDADLRGISEAFVDSTHESTRQQIRYAESIITREDWTVAAVIVTAPDRLQHFYWKYREPERFGLDPTNLEVQQRAGVIDRWWVEFDGQLDRLLQRVDLERTTLLVISDHGFEARLRSTGDCTDVEPNYLLREAGWLTLDASHRVVDERTLARELRIDEPASSPGARPNPRRHVRVDDAASLEAVRAMFESVAVGDRGERCFDAVRIEGTVVQMEARPDLSFATSDKLTLASPAGEREVLVERVLGRPLLRTGKHTQRGILLAAGAGVRRGVELDPIDGVQFTPTLLALLGLPQARDMDGAPAAELFAPGYLPRPPAAVASYDALVPREDAEEYDQDAVRDRLRGLGYVQ